MNQPPDDLRREWDYRYKERLAILCPVGEPTRQHIDMAAREADEWMEGEKENNQTKV